MTDQLTPRFKIVLEDNVSPRVEEASLRLECVGLAVRHCAGVERSMAVSGNTREVVEVAAAILAFVKGDSDA